MADIPASFYFPANLGPKDPELGSFRREGLKLLGLYLPGSGPMVIDPQSTENPQAYATLMHEQCHQMLCEFTPFGVFHAILEDAAARNAELSEAVRLSMKAQWYVQEGAATYAEMLIVARQGADRVREQILRLPSGRHGQPPYLEAFSAIADHVSLPAEGEARNRPIASEGVLILAMAAWSMSDDCLSRFSDPKAFSVFGFRRYLIDFAPNARFERLMNRLVADRHIQRLLDEIETRVDRQEPGASIDLWLLEFFSRLHDPDSMTADFSLGTLRDRAGRLTEAWGLDPKKGKAERVPERLALPAVLMDPTTYQSGVDRFEADATLTIPHIRQIARRAARNGRQLFLGLSTDGARTRIQLATYLPGKESATLGLPVDGLESNRSGTPFLGPLCEVLEALHPRPAIMLFRGFASWVKWSCVASPRVFQQDRVWVCTTRHGVDEWQIERMLRFNDIGQGKPYFRFAAHEGRTDSWAIVLNADRPRTALAILCTTDLSQALFRSIAENLGIEEAGEFIPGEYEFVGSILDFEHSPLIEPEESSGLLSMLKGMKWTNARP